MVTVTVQTANQGGVGSSPAGRAIGVVNGSPNTSSPCAKALVTGADHRSFFVAAGRALFIATSLSLKMTQIEFSLFWRFSPAEYEEVAAPADMSCQWRCSFVHCTTELIGLEEPGPTGLSLKGLQSSLSTTCSRS